MKPVLFITGGTGGHIFPALAVGESLRNLGISTLYVVRNDRKDFELIKKYNFEYKTMPARGFFGKKISGVFLFLFNFFKSMILFPMLIFKVKPSAVIATGSFISFAPAIWSIVLRKKFFLLEQNRIPGRLTKYFSRWASEIYLGFPLQEKIKGNLFYTGSPLRSEIGDTSLEDVSLDDKTILVLGGSQGAKFLNLNAVELAAQMPDFKFIIQTGKRDFSLIKRLVRSDNCELIDFTFSPENLYKKAKIVITRAGGVVLSEILLFGIPSIIIPFPFATDNHQRANAQFLAQNGAAIILDQGPKQELSKDFVLNLKTLILSIINDEEKWNIMRNNAKKIAKANANNIIANRIKVCLEN